MSALIRPADSNDIDSICSLLHLKMNSRIPVARWRQLMTYEWLANKPDFGQVVEADGQILGFCGMVYADRMIGDANAELREERIVSMSSWYLDKSLRGKGLGRDMLLASIQDPSLTYVTLTNSRKPLGIVEALGFQLLEERRFVWRKSGVADPAVFITQDPQHILDRVEPHQLQMMDDMSPYPVAPLWVETAEKQALMFFSIKRKDADVLWFDLMYSSDLDFFAACAQALADSLLPNEPAVLAADGRFVRNPPAEAVCEQLPVGRYFISERVEPHEIDHLYSELQLLDLKLD